MSSSRVTLGVNLVEPMADGHGRRLPLAENAEEQLVG